MSNYLTYICVKTCNQRHDKHNGVYVNKLEKMMMTDPTIVHLLSVLCGTIAIIVAGRVFIFVRDRQQRDKDNES